MGEGFTSNGALPPGQRATLDFNDLELCLIVTGLQVFLKSSFVTNETEGLQIVDLVERIHEETAKFVPDELQEEFEQDRALIRRTREALQGREGGHSRALPAPKDMPAPRSKTRLGEGNTLDVELDDRKLEAIITGLATLLAVGVQQASETIMYLDDRLRAQYPEVVAEAEQEIARFEEAKNVRSIDELLKNAIRPERP